jgi:superfamily I DNA/RNA helicase
MSYAPTAQQQAAIDDLLNPIVKMLQLRACAGAGKTSTLVLMAEALAEPSLYLAFNKATADEGSQRFPKHVECRTTHSMAYQVFGAKLRNKLQRPRGAYVNVAFTGSEVARFFKIDEVIIPVQGGDAIRLSPSFLGLLVRSTVACFEASADDEVQDKHIPTRDLKERLEDASTSMSYVKGLVLGFAKKLWKERINQNSVVMATHDTYLKLYQLSKPVFSHINVLYVDEFQDTTPCVLDIVLNQRVHGIRIVTVGDSRQAIYGWRGAVNAMEVMEKESKVRMLTKSFRYGQRVADVATAILQGEMRLEGFEKLDTVTGLTGVVDRSKPYTKLYRTNAALIADAVENVAEGIPVAIEIDTKDFVKVLESALALWRGSMKEVKHDKIVPYQDWDELVKESEDDPELKRLVKAMKENKVPRWIDVLQHFQNAPEPHITFTTAHKSKGREWDQVIVCNDFKEPLNEAGEWVGLAREEENLLYVACTRGKLALEYNFTASLYVQRFNEDGFESGVERMKREHNQMMREILEQ